MIWLIINDLFLLHFFFVVNSLLLQKYDTNCDKTFTWRKVQDQKI